MKRFYYLIAILLFSANSFAQGHFVLAFTGNGQDHMNINVVTATIGGVALETGDEIAAFDGTICCGKVTLSQPIVMTNPSSFAVIAASRKDDGQSNGYTIGNAITYKFWDSSKNLEFTGISTEYFDNTGSTIPAPTFTPNASTFVRLTVAGPANQAPASNAGPDQTVNEGGNVTLDGSGSSDPDGGTLTYLWTAPAGVTLSSTSAQKPTFTAPDVTVNTDYTFSLVVNDGLVNSPVDQVKITVLRGNLSPTANAGTDQSVNEGVIVTLDGTASTDPDSDVLTYSWTAPAGITLSSTTTSKPTFTAPEVSNDTQYSISLVVNDGTVNSVADQVIITVKQVNKAPTANAGPDQSVNENTLFTLDGSGSSDPDGGTFTYLWTAPAGITLSSTSAQKPTFTAPDVTLNTDYTFSLVVNDGLVNSPADQVKITVLRGNLAPTANAGTDQSVNEGVIVALDGTASTDPDSDALTFSWTAPAGITLSLATASKPTFTAPDVSTDTQYSFSLVVNDGTLNSVADQVIITVKQVNKAPVANAGPDQSVNENTLVTLDGSGSTDSDGNALTYLWTAPAGITLSSTSAQKPTFTAPDVTVNTDYTFSLVVNDGLVNSPADQVKITVLRGNLVPTANAGTDQSVNEGVIVTLDGTASTDLDSDALTYSWTAPAGITLSSATTSKPTFTAPEVSADTQYSISLVVNDGTVNSVADLVIIIVKQVNKAPTANAGPDQSVQKNTLVTLDGSGSSDPDGNALSYLWTAPAGITLSSTSAQKPTFTAPDVTVNTDYTFSLVVNDGLVNSPADQVKITVLRGNLAPTANAGTDQSVNEGVIVTLDGTASIDLDSDVLTYSWTAPAGITLSLATASKPTFTAPELSNDTQYSISLVVNDGTVNSVADLVIITVKQVNKAPTANAGPDQSVNENTLVTLDGSGSSDPDGGTLTYLWTAPAGITLSSTSAQKPTFIAPDVTLNTDNTFSLVVNDGLVNSPADQVKITVLRGNLAPTANAGTDQSVNEGVIVSLDGTASTDPDSDALTYSWTAPAGITLSLATASKPTFTAPDVSTDTQYSFSMVVNDGTVNSVADQVIITVKQVNRAPVANAGPDQSVNENTLFTLDGSASSDPDSDLLIYKWTAPAGITLSATNLAKPTFTAPDVNTNTSYTFTLIVNDGKLDSSADQVVITVKQDNKAPTANAGTDQSVNEGVIFTLDGTSSTDPDSDVLTYSWTAPAGITLNLATASKPTFTAPDVSTDTQYSFSLVVNDGTVNSVADLVIITVKQVNKAPVANAGPDQSFQKNTLVTLDGSGSSDPDGNALTYLWTAPAGVTFSSTSAQKPTFTAPDVTVNTDYTFSLVVNDGLVNSPADQVKITVLRGNLAPTANAGTDQSVNEGVTVSLDGSASADPDSNPLTYKWTAPAGITLSSFTAPKPNFTVPEVSTDTQYSFSLVVNDGATNSVSDEVIITVKNVDHAPYIKDPIKDISVNNGELPKVIDLKTIFSDDDIGDILKYTVSANSNDKIVSAIITGSDLIISFSTENFGLSDIVITASSNGKEVKSNFKVEVKKSTGIDPIETDPDVLIYPNPTKGLINLKFINTPKTETWITVTDISGKVIYKHLINNQEEHLNLKGNPSGLYFISVDNKFPKTYKIVLE